jgi:molecular chaperone GrpE (heat shock protein)
VTEKTNDKPNGKPTDDEVEFRVEDRRHWAAEETAVDEQEPSSGEVSRPSVLDEYRLRAETAEQKLQEYIEAHKSFRDEQEQVRVRLSRDVDRRVELQFGEVVTELLLAVDDLDLAIEHVSQVPEAVALAEGVKMARDRFLATLERHGVQRLSPGHEVFDPNESEALRVDPVDDEDLDGKVTEVVQPGYRLGERVIRPARVAVGRYVPGDS